MTAALAVMTSLKSLRLEFRSTLSPPDPESRRRPPPARFVLPALTQLWFKGVYEYLEDLLARIDVPDLYYLRVIFFMALNFDVPQLHQLIGHVEELKTYDRASVSIYNRHIRLILYSNPVEFDDCGRLELRIECRESEYQLWSLCQVCRLSFPLISALEELKIRDHYLLSSSHWEDDMENAQWPELLDSFTALRNLYLSDGIAQSFCGALQELSGERSSEVLPALCNLFVRGSSLQPVQEAMTSFVTARQFSDHPVVVDHWQD
jgi:hypothetical protein